MGAERYRKVEDVWRAVSVVQMRQQPVQQGEDQRWIPVGRWRVRKRENQEPEIDKSAAKQSRAESETGKKRSLGGAGAGVGQTSLPWTNAAEGKRRMGRWKKEEREKERRQVTSESTYSQCVLSKRRKIHYLTSKTSDQSAPHYISAVQGEDGAMHGGVKSGAEWERITNGEERDNQEEGDGTGRRGRGRVEQKIRNCEERKWSEKMMAEIWTFMREWPFVTSSGIYSK